jgi:hypothetical protein
MCYLGTTTMIYILWLPVVLDEFCPIETVSPAEYAFLHNENVLKAGKFGSLVITLSASGICCQPPVVSHEGLATLTSCVT